VSDYSDQQIEHDIVTRGLNALRLTPDTIESVILAEQYYRFPHTTVTVCCLTLRNGYNVIGEAAAVSAENFDAEIGQKVARQHAKDKIWALEGYLLKQKLYTEVTSDVK